MMVPYDEGWRQYQIDISPTSIMELSFFDSDHKFNYQIFDNFFIKCCRHARWCGCRPVSDNKG